MNAHSKYWPKRVKISFFHYQNYHGAPWLCIRAITMGFLGLSLFWSAFQGQSYSRHRLVIKMIKSVLCARDFTYTSIST